MDHTLVSIIPLVPRVLRYCCVSNLIFIDTLYKKCSLLFSVAINMEFYAI